MVCLLDGSLPEAATDSDARTIQAGDSESLGRLMFESYRGTPDDEGEDESAAVAEIGRTLSGTYGPFDFRASEVVVKHGRMVSATLVTDYRGDALIAFTMTSPAWTRQGLARAGLVRVLHRLREAGREEAFLAVSTENVIARRLYESLGFVDRPVR